MRAQPAPISFVRSVNDFKTPASAVPGPLLHRIRARLHQIPAQNTRSKRSDQSAETVARRLRQVWMAGGHPDVAHPDAASQEYFWAQPGWKRRTDFPGVAEPQGDHEAPESKPASPAACQRWSKREPFGGLGVQRSFLRNLSAFGAANGRAGKREISRERFEEPCTCSL